MANELWAGFPVENCNCLVGEPYINKDGSCGCTDTMPQGTGGIKPIPSGQYYSVAQAQQKKLFNKLSTFQTQNQNAPQCAGLTAPNGYHYIWNGNACVLAVNYDSDTSVIKTASKGVSDALGGITNSPFFQNNKSLIVLGALGIGAYLMLGRGMKPKSRVVESTTRY